jgi:hypothetical protein
LRLRRKLCLALGLVLLAGPPGLLAEPWVAPGHVRMRHDLELLYDSGILSGPSLSWPLSWPDIARDLGRADASRLPPGTAAALLRVRNQLIREQRLNDPALSAEVSVGAHPIVIRTFDDTPREDLQASVALDGLGQRFAWRLQATVVSQSEDDQTWRPDGSYLAASLGNWMISVGYMDRWWGPGWDGSLILGTNARPVPAIAIERQESTPLDVPVLRWLGPWRLVTFMGQLEGDRDYPHTLLFGMRVELRPVPSLQLAASRSAQWCGDGRPCTWDDFWNLLTGNDNDQPNEEQPGNQLAGFDLRWTWPGGAVPVAFYAQTIGEDEAGFLPSKYLGLFGLETWGDAGDRSWRAHVEFADTTCNFLGTQQYGCAYYSGIYNDGYRYRGYSLGHSTDSDAESLGIGGILVDSAGREWRALARDMRLNRAGKAINDPLADGPADVWDVELTHRRPFAWGTLEASVGYSGTDADRGVDLSVDEGWRGFISWRHELR